MRFPSLNDLTTKAVDAFKRFPLTILWSTLGSFAIIFLIEADDGLIFEEYLDLTATLVLGVSWLIAAQFFCEQSKNPRKLWWIKGIVLAFLALFYFTFLPHGETYGDTVTYTRFWLYLFAGHLGVFVAPFILSWNAGAYFNYIKNIMIALGRSALFSAVLYLGLVLAMLAVDALFNVDIDGNRYGQLFVFCLGIVNTWVYLSDFPERVQEQLRVHFNKATEVFVKYILIPLVALYFVILYAYSLKILIQWELPEGWVGYLVTALAFLILVVQFIIHPVRHSHGSRIVRKFSPLCYYLLLPLTVLLFVAIFRRMNDYGLTINRYLLTVVAIFIVVASIYLIFSRKQQLRFLVIGLFAATLLVSFGPWGVFSTSAYNQLDEMERELLRFKEIQKGNGDENPIVDVNQFNDITSYLHHLGHLKKSEEFLGYDPVATFGGKDDYYLGSSILEKEGIDVKNLPDRTNYNFYTIEYTTIALKGYDYLLDFPGNTWKETKQKKEGYSVKIDYKSNSLELQQDGRLLIKLALDEFMSGLTKKGSNYETLDAEEMAFAKENQEAAVKVYFQTFTFDRAGDGFKLSGCSGKILFKSKTYAP